MKAWLFQDPRQKKKHGDKAPWCVGWLDPDGKRKSQRIGTKSAAEKFARKTEGELAAGVYESKSRATWQQFVTEYESRVLARLSPSNKAGAMAAMNNFERLAKPGRMKSITTNTIDKFITARMCETVRGKKRPSPATVNRDLRYLRMILRKAHKWDFVSRVPEFTFLREPGKIAVYVPPEHFAALYKAADMATLPESQPYAAADWWRALFVVAYMTGWRIGQILALRWGDVNLDKGTALSRAADNKGKRDQLIPLHPLVVDHLRRIKSFSPVVFPWKLDRKDLYDGLHAIQDAAGVKPEHGKAYYGFHDFRRAFATLNAENLTADALQMLMQHKSYTTTQRYINMARQANQSVAALYVPNLATDSATG